MIKFIRRLKTWHIPTLLITPIICLIIGYYAGLGFYHMTNYFELHTTWRTLPKPPSNPIKLIGAKPDCVFIKTVDGNKYFYCDLNQESWEKVSEPIHIPARYSCPEGTFPDAPKGTIQTVEACHGIESYTFAQFALTHKGDIKIYHVRTDPMGQLGLGLFSIFCGSVLGLIAGIGFVIYILKNRNESSVNQNKTGIIHY